MISGMRAPIAPPEIFRCRDIDKFRTHVRDLNLDFTPLAKTIFAEQIVLRLPLCELVLSKTYPRIVDAQIARNCTAIAFTMEDEAPILFNGVMTDKPLIAVGRNGACYSAVERAANQSALIFFNCDLEERGWPQTRESFGVFQTSFRAQTWLRELMGQIFAVTAGDLNSFEGVLAGVGESLFAGLDAAFADIVPAKWATRANSAQQLKLFRDIRAALCGDMSRPIYSQALAQELGVSTRNMHDAVVRCRGMSLHRYLRLRRLWLVRKRLLAGADSVKACALAFGFWHLGDFARSYRVQFGESPSETLTRRC